MMIEKCELVVRKPMLMALYERQLAQTCKNGKLASILQVHLITFSYPSEVLNPASSETPSLTGLVARHVCRASACSCCSVSPP